MPRSLSRRRFLQTAAAGSAAAVGYFSSRSATASDSPNEKLNVAVVGVAGRGAGNLDGVQSENIVALCDVDDMRLSGPAGRFASAKTYHDFRKMLEQKDIDAVVISTPDHTHAVAAMAAIKQGKHVYCEKPLTLTVHEARAVAREAAKMKVATQMGTQIHAGDNYRRAVEIIQAGAIGPVKEVHVWVGTIWGGGDRPAETPEVPPHIKWDLWLGPAPQRPYHPTYIPFFWRRWWDFGGGALNDMACHFMDLPFWALDLRYPTSVAAEGPAVHPETAAVGLRVAYEFPARGSLPAVKLTWYDGNMAPKELHGIKLSGGGVLFVGEKGQLLADYGSRKLYPESEFAGYQPPEPTIPNSIGHHREWIEACKHGTPTTCNFDYSGALTETVLLGTVAYRSGEKLAWDPAQLKATNSPAAEAFLRREYRKGWSL